MKPLTRWAPAALLAAAAILGLGMQAQRTVPLRSPLAATIPSDIADFQSRDLPISAAEREAAGMSQYVMRVYERAGGGKVGAEDFSLYVGYYASQEGGRSIHSPKNCLPGAGWEALSSRRENIAGANGVIPVNRYLIQRGSSRALVLYWYQGRGRVEANEYAVKWNLLRDRAFRRRSDEALVRVIVPITRGENEAYRIAASVAPMLAGAVERALPS